MRLWLFLTSCLFAFLAGHMVNYSVIFLSLQWFDSHTLAGLGYGLCFGPPVILGWFAGVYCDRYSPRKVILVAQNSYLISLALITIAMSWGEWQIPLLLCAALFSGVAWSFVAPARFATLPFYVTKQQLTGATIALNLIVMMGFGLAPMLLKWIEANWGWTWVISISGALAILSSAILLPLKFEFRPQAENRAFTEIKASLALVRSTPMIQYLLLLAAVIYLLMGPMQVLLPSIAQHHLGLSTAAQGNYLSLVAFSLIIGGLMAMKLKSQGHLGVQMLLAVLISGMGLAYLGIEQQLSLSVLVLIISGCAGGIGISLIVAGLQHYSPDQYRGRIMSIYTIIGQFIPAVSGVFAGLLANHLDFAKALSSFGVAITLIGVLLFIGLKPIRSLQSY